MSSYIPKVQEQDYQRKIRVLTEKVDELAGRVDGLARNEPAPNAEVPEAVKMAFTFIQSFQRSGSSPFPYMGYDPPSEREPTDSELAALGSACELLEDYFDRHNSRILRERQRAEQMKATKHRKAIRVTKGRP